VTKRNLQYRCLLEHVLPNSACGIEHKALPSRRRGLQTAVRSIAAAAHGTRVLMTMSNAQQKMRCVYDISQILNIDHVMSQKHIC
jgi:hypothetical protein